MVKEFLSLGIELDLPSYSPVNLDKVPDFFPKFLDNKYIVNIPSYGLPRTAVAQDKISRVLYNQDLESVLINSKGGIMVNYVSLPHSEQQYHEMLFSKLLPPWITITSFAGYNTLGLNDTVPPLDQAVLHNPLIIAQIKKLLSAYKKQDVVLYGYYQTHEMQSIANILNIPYYGSPKFALWAGSKIGLQEFLEKYDLPRLHTVTVFNIEDVASGLEYLQSKNYERAVFKVNFSTGGIGHRIINIKEALSNIRMTKLEDVVPEIYTAGEGLVLQGWVEKRYQGGMASLDFLVDFDNSFYPIHAKTKFYPINNAEVEAGYLPIDQNQLSSLMSKMKKIEKAYTKENAIGPHCVNFLYINAEGAARYGLPENTPLIHDENPRIGDGKTAHYWVQRLKGHEANTGWCFKRLAVNRQLGFQDLLNVIDEHGLLIKHCGDDVNGVFLYKGGYMEVGQTEVFILAISAQNDPLEAARMINKVENIINQN